MGRRRRRAVQLQKKDNKLDIAFDCPFCNNLRSVEVKLKRPVELAELKCRACGVGYSCRINYLMEPVDVYAEWVDEAAEKKIVQEREARKKAETERMIGQMSREGRRRSEEQMQLGNGGGASSSADAARRSSSASGRDREAGRRSRSRRRENADADTGRGDSPGGGRKKSRAGKTEEEDLFGEVE